jgi:quinol monooxygenase YgiN
MFARHVECTVKPGKKEEFTKTLRDQVLPLLRRQPGFVEEIGLVSDNDPERTIYISLWRSREDAERYQREQFSSIVGKLQPLLKNTPKAETFDVDTATAEKISTRVAA